MKVSYKDLINNKKRTGTLLGFNDQGSLTAQRDGEANIVDTIVINETIKRKRDHAVLSKRAHKFWFAMSGRAYYIVIEQGQHYNMIYTVLQNDRMVY